MGGGPRQPVDMIYDVLQTFPKTGTGIVEEEERGIDDFITCPDLYVT